MVGEEGKPLLPSRTYVTSLALMLVVCTVAGCAAKSGRQVRTAGGEAGRAVNPAAPACPPEMALVPAGEFRMGCSEGDPDCFYDEFPARSITITEPFCMDRYEVSQGDYEKVAGANPSKFSDCGAGCPVDSVRWDEAMAYCEKIGKRLPTEAEWEYAARGDAATRFYWGREADPEYAWYAENSVGGPHTVGERIPNAYGLYDMTGNVMEWTWDAYDGRWYARMPEMNPVNTSDKKDAPRSVRGGSWRRPQRNQRVSSRFGLVRKGFLPDLGFRCVRD